MGWGGQYTMGRGVDIPWVGGGGGGGVDIPIKFQNFQKIIKFQQKKL